jgi:hypothetical protein
MAQPQERSQQRLQRCGGAPRARFSQPCDAAPARAAQYRRADAPAPQRQHARRGAQRADGPRGRLDGARAAHSCAVRWRVGGAASGRAVGRSFVRGPPQHAAPHAPARGRVAWPLPGPPAVKAPRVLLFDAPPATRAQPRVRQAPRRDGGRQPVHAVDRLSAAPGALPRRCLLRRVPALAAQAHRALLPRARRPYRAAPPR